MGYSTGVCNSYSDIVTTLVNIVKNLGTGWEELKDSSNYSVLHKDNMYVQVRTIYSGAGILGRTSLNSGQPINLVGIGDFHATDGAKLGPTQFPINYYCFTFTNPDEIYFIIKDRDRYQFIAFGKSNINFTTGTGLWTTGTMGLTSTIPIYICLADSYFDSLGGVYYSSYSNIYNRVGPAPFWSYTYDGTTARCYNNTWINTDSGWIANTYGARPLGALFASQPNEFNNQALFLPITCTGGANLTLTNARYVRNNFIDPEEIVYHGNEQWVVFPFFRKVNIYKTNLTNLDSSLTFGWAIKKET